MKKILQCILFIVLIAGCTDNEKARNFGGTESITIPENNILLNITWKGDDMWLYTQDTTTGMKYFRESSSYGIWEGQIIIKEGTKTEKPVTPENADFTMDVEAAIKSLDTLKK